MRLSPATDTTDAPAEADASCLSRGKAEILPMLKGQLSKAFRQPGLDADPQDVEQMAVCLYSQDASLWAEARMLHGS